MTNGSTPQHQPKASVHARAPEPFPIVATLITAVLLVVWLSANLWAQPLSDWIGARLSDIEMYWLANRQD